MSLHMLNQRVVERLAGKLVHMAQIGFRGVQTDDTGILQIQFILVRFWNSRT